MRAIFAVALLAMIACSTASRTGIQAKMIHDGMGAKMQGRSLGRALKMMAELNQLAPNGAQALLDALARLKDNITEKREYEVEDFASDSQSHTDEVGRLEHNISENEQSLQRLSEELERFEFTEHQLSESFDSQNARLTQAKAERDQTSQLMQDLATAHEATQNDYAIAINLLDQCIETLRATQNWNANLIQKNRSQYRDLSKSLEEQFSANEEHSFFIAPITAVLTQLATSGDELDLQTVVQALDSIISLRTSFIDGLAEETSNFEIASKNYDQVLTEIKNEIQDLGVIMIPKTSQDLADIKETIAAQSEEYTTTQNTLAFLQGALEAENATFVNRVQQNELLVPELDSEYQAVVQTQAVIQNTLNRLG